MDAIALTSLSRHLVDVAVGRKPADLVIRDGRWVNVQSGEIIPNTDIAITKERIALLISIDNGCKMCVDVHKNIAKMLGMSEEQVEEVLEGVDAIHCEESEKALLRFCIRASQKDSHKMMQEDIDAIKEAGYSEAQILEAVAITGYFNYINTLSNVFGLGK